MSERTFIKTNKPERSINKAKVKNEPIISETTLKPKAHKESEKNKNSNVAVIAEKGSIIESNLTTDKIDSKTSKATEISKSKKLDLKRISVFEENMNKYQAVAVEKKGSKKKQNIGCRTKAVFTNEQAQKNLSSGDNITRKLESKKYFTKEKVPKIKGKTKEKSLKLENEQKIFKLKDDKRVLHVKEKFSKNKSTKRSVYEKPDNSSIPADKIEKEFKTKISESTEERKLNFDKEINQTDFNMDTKDTLTKIMTHGSYK